MKTCDLSGQRQGRGPEVRITLFYVAVAALWILFSDRLLERFVADPATLGLFQTYKGWGFVLFTGLLLYGLIRHFFLKILQREETICRLAYFDRLTGLPNQVAFEEELSEVLAKTPRAHHAVIFLDLERFKTFTRTLGQEAGNELSRQVGERWSRVLAGRGKLARFSGDEFAVLVEEISDRSFCADLAEELLAALDEPCSVMGHPIFPSAWAGIVCYPEDGHSAEVLLRHAGTAMLRARLVKHPPIQFFSPELKQHSMATLDLESRLRKALIDGDFLVLYQPQYDPTGHTILGLEALVSWRNAPAQGGTAAEFIPLAEETGLIEPLGEWVLRTAFRQWRTWQEEGVPPARLSVNLSARQFQREDLVERIAALLRETGADPAFLELEVTETVLMQNLPRAVADLQKLVDMGMRVAVDDFGTGYSSLSYLRCLPVHTLKLDQSLVAEVSRNQDDAAIAGAVIALGHALGLQVVAEGVENEAQRAFMEERGCDLVQGYLFCAPLGAQECGDLLGRKAQGSWMEGAGEGR